MATAVRKCPEAEEAEDAEDAEDDKRGLSIRTAQH